MKSNNGVCNRLPWLGLHHTAHTVYLTCWMGCSHTVDKGKNWKETGTSIIVVLCSCKYFLALFVLFNALQRETNMCLKHYHHKNCSILNEEIIWLFDKRTRYEKPEKGTKILNTVRFSCVEITIFTKCWSFKGIIL